MSSPSRDAKSPLQTGGRQLASQFLLLFIAGTLIPLGIVSVMVLQAVTNQLEDQSEQRLRQASRATGMAVLGRLTALETELRVIADGSPPDLASINGRFLAIGLFRRDGSVRWIRGDVAGSGAALETLAGLAPDRAGLVTNEAGIFLAVRAGEGTLPFVGAVQPDHLLHAARNTLPPDGQFCLAAPGARLIGCSESLTLPALASYDSTSGPVEVANGGEDLRGQYWSLFLNAQFASEPWLVVLLEPVAAIHAPLAEFRALFALAVGLAFLLVLLVNLQQIRRRLAPLHALVVGTREVAAGNFSARASTSGNNEFGELAHSFNFMAGALDQHFKAQEETLEFDRHLIAAADEASIAGHLAEHLMALTSAVDGFVGIDREGAESLALASVGNDGNLETSELYGATEWRAFLAEHPEAEMLPESTRFPGIDRNPAAQVFAWLPLFANQQPAGFALLRFERDPGGLSALASAQQIVARASVALGNLRTIESNRFLTYYDALTGLPNRALFKERLRQALSRSEEGSIPLAVFITGLDDVQNINETLGHSTGDQLLQVAATRLAEEFGEGCVARIAGNEFGIIVEEFSGKAAAVNRAEAWTRRLDVPVEIDGRSLQLSASTGVAVAPDDARTVEALISGSDAALNAARQTGGGAIHLFTSEMNERARERMELIEALREAIDQQEFRVFYQPVIDVETRSISSAEALVRWQRPGHGLVGPEAFIGVAEENGLEVGIGAWVMAQACRDIAAWKSQQLDAPRIAVNLSARQVQDPGLRAQVLSALGPVSLHPECLSFELTERSLMDGDVTENLDRLRRLGIRLAVDDFGTGYSSLGYLQRFPLDVLKIDMSFIRGLPDNEQAATITRACIAMAHGLGMEVIAEGVETEAQFSFLREFGCDYAQGYLFSDPVPEDAFVKLLKQDDF
ncbi:MAG: EAL domain-containing protein [bacterium]|nr:EAL domain-containing protein [bacterium]